MELDEFTQGHVLNFHCPIGLDSCTRHADCLPHCRRSFLCVDSASCQFPTVSHATSMAGLSHKPSISTHIHQAPGRCHVGVQMLSMLPRLPLASQDSLGGSLRKFYALHRKHHACYKSKFILQLIQFPMHAQIIEIPTSNSLYSASMPCNLFCCVSQQIPRL